MWWTWLGGTMGSCTIDRAPQSEFAFKLPALHSSIVALKRHFTYLFEPKRAVAHPVRNGHPWVPVSNRVRTRLK